MTKKRGRPPGNTPGRKTISMRILVELWAQAKEAAHFERTTVTAEVERMLSAWVAACQKKHNGGEPFGVKK